MYFLRIKPLKNELISQGLVEKERFKYLMAWMIMIGLATGPGSHINGASRFLLIFGVVLITILGVWYAYHRNGGQSGTALLDRYFSLGWVINLRVMLLLLFVFPLVFHLPFIRRIAEYLDYISFNFTSLFSQESYYGDGGSGSLFVLTVLMAEVYIAWAIGRHIGDVRQASETGFIPATAATPPVRSLSVVAPPVGTAPSATPSGALMPSGLDPQTSQQLERFVETVVQRELATAGYQRTAPAPRPRKLPHPPRRRKI